MSETKTSIQISKATKERLAKMGGKGDTYDGIIQDLLTLAEASIEARTDIPRLQSYQMKKPQKP